jgi:hypothetical protein
MKFPMTSYIFEKAIWNSWLFENSEFGHKIMMLDWELVGLGRHCPMSNFMDLIGFARRVYLIQIESATVKIVLWTLPLRFPQGENFGMGNNFIALDEGENVLC